MALFGRKSRSSRREASDSHSHSDVDDHDHEHEHKSKDKGHSRLRIPPNTAFRQQRLKAWQPILTPKTVLPTFFLVAIIFAPIGGLLLWASNQVNEFTIDYTSCDSSAPTDGTLADLPSSSYSYHVHSSTSGTFTAPRWQYSNSTGQRTCTILFNVPADLKPPVYMYYKLTNYYQNHRRYVRSLDTSQLQGNVRTTGDLSGGECKPLDQRDGKPIYPCGLIANSVFNDTFTQPILLNPSGTGTNITYNMTSTGIAWPGESKKYAKTRYTNDECVPPPFWVERFPGGVYSDQAPIPDLSTDEHFQVWMRTAGLPTFRKLYARNDAETMGNGVYSMDVRMLYPVAQFDGTKSIVFSTVSFIGGRNPFLGIAYIVVGGLCALVGLLLTLRHFVRPRKLGDLGALTWNKPKEK